MPLIDHFHPPLATLRPWASFHARWAVAICDSLNLRLPADHFFADVQINVGTRIEADVAEFELQQSRPLTNGQGTETLVLPWTAPAPARTTPFAFDETIEVQVFDHQGGKQLVAAVELVSPANKDRGEHRWAFTAKVASYLHHGVGVLVVDVVTDRHANLHHELMARLGEAGLADLPEDCLYAIAYRPARRQEANQLDLWPARLDLGQPLPTLPLALRGLFFVPIDLEATYTEARERLHL